MSTSAITGETTAAPGGVAPQPATAPESSIQQSRARGRACRAKVPRSAHGDWSPPPSRPDPIALLAEQATTRIPELVPIRYGRMAASPLAFYRGAAYVMASDLASTPRSGLVAQLCGDAHLSNFGGFAAPDRRLVFDINDFDETLPGPWEWDVKRLAASLEIAARDIGAEAPARRAVVRAALARYRGAMRDFATMHSLDVWYARLEEDELLALVEKERLASRNEIKLARRQAQKARHKDSLRALAKLTRLLDGEVRFISEPPLIVPADELVGGDDRDAWRAPARRMLAQYRETLGGDMRHLVDQYRFVDLARKVVGVGSVGTRTWVALSLSAGADDALFLQLKEAQPSVLERFLAPSRYRSHGRRVVEGQRLMQAASDVLLGWFHGLDIDGLEHDFYARQLWDWKGSAEVASLGAESLRAYGEMCGWTLARAHARSGDRVAIAAYLGQSDVFDRAIVRFSAAYAKQNERDHAELLAAIDAGRVQATMGV